MIKKITFLVSFYLLTHASYASEETTTANLSNLDSQTLLGDWVRPDGGYVIRINKIDANNKLDANYFNPSSIQVVQAKLTETEPKLKLTIELTGQGYDGSIYKLEHNAEHDILMGTYLQGVSRQTYQVVFQRKKNR